MALIELKNKARPNNLTTRSRAKVTYGDKIEISAKEALTYLGDNTFNITFVPTDKKELRTCNARQLEWLRREFGVKGDIDKILNKMFPEPTIKKKIKTEIKNMMPVEDKKETTSS